MTKIYSSDELTNVKSSVARYLKNTYYYRNDRNSGTLPSYYTGLTVTLGFPGDLTSMTLPTVAIDSLFTNVNDILSYGEWVEKGFYMRASVFAGGARTNSSIDEGANKLMQDRLTNDIKNLLDANSVNNAIDLYNYTDIIQSGTSYKIDGDIEITDVSATLLEPTGDIESDRYRGVVDFTASIIYSQD